MKCDIFKTTAIVLAVLAFLLFAGGFFVPPVGVIDGSVLTAGGELLGFVAIFFAWHSVDNGKSATIQHGNTTATIGGDNDEG